MKEQKRNVLKLMILVIMSVIPGIFGIIINENVYIIFSIVLLMKSIKINERTVEFNKNFDIIEMVMMIISIVVIMFWVGQNIEIKDKNMGKLLGDIIITYLVYKSTVGYMIKDKKKEK